ncbi:MAG: FCD domain-containing protein [Actinobacteria bacterium]|uniref:Unannotated protein n=1 Tax=freshwater metagenome TaxID=449393 RepID=A0A6J7LX07_9ZZZZ|nr:FCD domain-containing protein [Actinomycetota bacterium]
MIHYCIIVYASLMADREGPRPRPLGRVSTVEALAKALRERILSGDEVPGAPLREAELCAMFGVSRHSLRTAMRSLVPTGLIRYEANYGMYVSKLDTHDVEDIYQIRKVLEAEAVLHLCSHQELLGPAERALVTLESLDGASDWALVRDADLAFHQSMVDALGRRRMSSAYAGLMDEMSLAFRQLRPEFEDVAGIQSQHRDIFNAVFRGDESLALRLTTEHLTNAENDITRELDQFAR